MEMSIQKDEEDEKIYTTTIKVNNKVIILETLWHGRRLYYLDHDTPVVNWVSMIKKLQEKKKEKKLIISLVADRSEHYRNSSFISRWGRPAHMSKTPFELLQLCVDNHCLFHETEISYSAPTALLKLLSDNKTVVVGLGIEDVAKKLENDFNFKINNWVDLRDKAREKAIFGEIANNCSVEKLAKKVLGDEWDVKKPAIMDWSNGQPYPNWFLSDDKVKFGSLEAFLAYRIGTNLLEN